MVWSYFSASIVVLMVSIQHQSVFSQQLEFDWANSMGSEFIDEGIHVGIDSQSNSYFTGFFKDTVDADPSPGVYTLISNGSQDIYVIKKDIDGNLLWAKSFGCDLGESSLAISITSSDFIYLGGAYSDTVDLDLGTGTSMYYSEGNSDVFVTKLDLGGNQLWTKTIGSTGYDEIRSIVSDSNDNIYLAGFFSDTVDFDPGPGVHYEIGSTDNSISSAFLLKLDFDGNFIWVRIIKGLTADVKSTATFLDSTNNLYLTGSFEDDADFDPSAGIEMYSSVSSSKDVFIQRYDTSGNYFWTRVLGGTNWDEPLDGICDNTGNVLLTGFFRSFMDLDPGPGVTNVSTTGAADWDSFILKLDSLGNFQWGHDIGGSGYDVSRVVVTDPYDNVYTAGTFSGTVDFDPGPASATMISVLSDLFVNKYDKNGNYLWARKIGGSSVDEAYDMTIDPSGDLFLTGHFWNTVDFDFGPGINNCISYGERDAFFLKFSQCDFTNLTLNSPALPDVNSECEVMSITAPTATNNCGNVVTAIPDITFPISDFGTTVIEWSFDNWGGNDTGQLQTVIIDPIDSTVTFDGITISANVAGYSYQWYKCITGFPVIGENNQSFTPQSDGVYQVEISNGSCSVLSECITVEGVGMSEVEMDNIFVYPNPTNGSVVVKGNSEILYIEIVNATGEVVISEKTSSIQHQVNLSSLSDGLYFIRTYTESSYYSTIVTKN